jgi:ABC-type nitrate/sulfonate/bicarbonate transport system substrate-binding protein
VLTLQKYGLDKEGDVDIRHLPPPEVSSAVVSGVADAQTICEQYSTYPEYFGRGKVIAHCLDSGPHQMPCDGTQHETYTQCTALAARPGLPKEMMEAVIEAHKIAAKFMADNPKETVAIAAQVAGTPAPMEHVAMFNRARWHYGLNYESVDKVWNGTMRKIGLGKKSFKVDEMIDTQYAVELKPPFQSTAGVNKPGPVDVTSDEFRRRVWDEAMTQFKL